MLNALILSHRQTKLRSILPTKKKGGEIQAMDFEEVLREKQNEMELEINFFISLNSKFDNTVRKGTIIKLGHEKERLE
jgi:hypothetical protein